jgi:hypothetical protein
MPDDIETFVLAAANEQLGFRSGESFLDEGTTCR